MAERGRTLSRIQIAKAGANFRGRKSNSLMNLCGKNPQMKFTSFFSFYYWETTLNGDFFILTLTFWLKAHLFVSIFTLSNEHTPEFHHLLAHFIGFNSTFYDFNLYLVVVWSEFLRNH